MTARVCQVNCYSGHSYAQRPRSFVIEGAAYEVAAVIKEEYTPFGKEFLVKTPDGDVYNLNYHSDRDEWLVSIARQPVDPQEEPQSYDQ